MPVLRRISIESTEYILGPVTFVVGGADVDWSGDTVEVAVVAAGSAPQNTDWCPADVEIDHTVTPPRRSTRLLIGPGSPDRGALTAGLWDHYSRPHQSPELPVLFHGTFEAY